MIAEVVTSITVLPDFMIKEVPDGIDFPSYKTIEIDVTVPTFTFALTVKIVFCISDILLFFTIGFMTKIIMLDPSKSNFAPLLQKLMIFDPLSYQHQKNYIQALGVLPHKNQRQLKI